MYPDLGTILYLDKKLIFEILIQIVNTCIICFFLAKNIYIPVKNFMKNRSDTIQKEISTAEQKLSEAYELKDLYEEKLAGIENERTKILDGAHKRGLEREDQIIREAREEAEVIKNRVMIEIDREKVKAKEEMKNQIIDISSLIASKVINENIQVDKQSNLVDSAIEELGDVKWLG